MAENSRIEWTDSTWNPTVGCSVLSPGCTNCYAMKMAGRLEAMGQPIYRGHTIKTKSGYVWNGKVAASNWGQVIKPLSWKKPRRIFVNSMSDLFHEDMPELVIDQVFAVMALCPHHTFQVLTKRAERMRRYFEDQDLNNRISTSLGSMLDGDWIWDNGRLRDRIEHLIAVFIGEDSDENGDVVRFDDPIPLPNVWLGVSVEDQPRADERIPHLLATPAAVRFLSCEPLLGQVDLRRYLIGKEEHGIDMSREVGSRVGACTGWTPPVDWVIAGGESGPGKRPMDLAWMRSLRDQCAADDVAFFAKQIDKVRELPEDLRVRQMPERTDA